MCVHFIWQNLIFEKIEKRKRSKEFITIVEPDASKQFAEAFAQMIVHIEMKCILKIEKNVYIQILGMFYIISVFVISNQVIIVCKFVYIFSCLFTKNLINCIVVKRILALPTQGQKCILSELQPFEVATFDLGHPVRQQVPCISNTNNRKFLTKQVLRNLYHF